MTPKRAKRGPIGTLSSLFERARILGVSALARSFRESPRRFSTLTSTDQRALAAVLRPRDMLLSSGNTRSAALVKRLTRSTWPVNEGEERWAALAA